MARVVEAQPYFNGGPAPADAPTWVVRDANCRGYLLVFAPPPAGPHRTRDYFAKLEFDERDVLRGFEVRREREWRDAGAYFARAAVRDSLGNDKEAIQDLDQAINRWLEECVSFMTAAYEYRAAMHDKRGEIASAQADLQKAQAVRHMSEIIRGDGWQQNDDAR